MVYFCLFKFEQINNTFEHHNLFFMLLVYFELWIDSTTELSQKYSNRLQTLRSFDNPTILYHGNDHWNTDLRPAAKMISAFLIQSVGKDSDSQLDIHIGLQANKLIEEILFSYNNAMVSWLKNNLISPLLKKDDLKYALREILLINRHSPEEAESLIDRIQEVFGNDSVNYWLDRLDKGIDPLELIRKITLN